MSLSLFVDGIRPPDDRWKAMKAIYDLCEHNDVPIPDTVDEFFNGEPPDPDGVIIDLESFGAAKEWRDENYEGYIIDLSKLPADLKYIRMRMG